MLKALPPGYMIVLATSLLHILLNNVVIIFFNDYLDSVLYVDPFTRQTF